MEQDYIQKNKTEVTEVLAKNDELCDEGQSSEYNLTKCLTLSPKAKNDLKKILIADIGEERANKFNDEGLNVLGTLFLTILAEGLKLKVSRRGGNMVN